MCSSPSWSLSSTSIILLEHSSRMASKMVGWVEEENSPEIYILLIIINQLGWLIYHPPAAIINSLTQKILPPSTKPTTYKKNRISSCNLEKLNNRRTFFNLSPNITVKRFCQFYQICYNSNIQESISIEQPSEFQFYTDRLRYHWLIGYHATQSLHLTLDHLNNCDIYSHYGGYVSVLQVGIQILLYLCYLVNVLDGDFHEKEVPGQRGELFLTGCLLQKPRCLWRFDLEFEASVGEGNQPHLEGHIWPDVGGDFIEFLTEFHHVDTQRTQSLSHFGVGFGHPCEYSKVDGC